MGYQIGLCDDEVYQIKVNGLFLRVNQSEIVSRDFVKDISGNIVCLRDKTEMPIGRTYRKELMKQYFGR